VVRLPHRQGQGIERRWHDDELIGADSSFLAVELEDGTCAGWVTWRAVAGSNNFEIGIALFTDHRGHGVGTQAQRQLVSYLFDTTTANRLQAGTELDNVAEQRSLERVGAPGMSSNGVFDVPSSPCTS
jgi:[ribosomal protein S5]-alanine N-acetyltransferase